MVTRRKIKVMNFLINGYYGHKNSGDDALAYVVIEQLAKKYQNSHFNIVSVSDIVVPSNANVTFARRRRFVTLREIPNSDIIVFGGGGIIQDYGSLGTKSLKRILGIVKFAKLLKKKVWFIGISIGPLNTTEGKELACAIFERSDFVAVRDQESYNFLKQINVKCPKQLSVDMALLLDTNTNYKLKENKKTLGLSIIPFNKVVYQNSKKDNIIKDNFSIVIERLLQEHPQLEVKLFSFHDGVNGDQEYLEEIKNSIKDKRLTVTPYCSNPKKMLDKVGECDFFMGMRLHANIFAYIKKVPFCIIGYHPKSYGFAKTIDMDPSDILDIDSLYDSQLLYEKIKKLIVNPNDFMKIKSVESLKIEAQKNFMI